MLTPVNTPLVMLRRRAEMKVAHLYSNAGCLVIAVCTE
ncbi:Uncharacterized protein dnm_003720 [Desulfonema magnum]|uniref:Uncharacterized protein n=1 Tax=Desulfonema magnum TaxID=45655 RepID=A0A975BFK4_9BACT|nr:Uncharacterized protein dnm_003720 [Desulfonema magnum]